MRSIAGLLATASLIACSPSSSSEEDRSTETITIFPIAYKWHNDPKCFKKGAKVTKDLFADTISNPDLLLWGEPKRFSGQISGWSDQGIGSFISDKPPPKGRVGFSVTLYANSILAADPDLSRSTSSGREVFQIEFIGREARCNRPGDDTSLRASGDLIIADKLISSRRIKMAGKILRSLPAQ